MEGYNLYISRIKPISKTYKIYLKGWDLLTKAKISTITKRRAEIIREVKIFLKHAEKYHFNRLASEFALYLHYYYCMIVSDRSKSDRYLKTFRKYSELAKIEEEVQAIFTELSYKINNKRANSEQLNRELLDVYKKLKKHLQLESAPINICIYSLEIARYYINHDYDNIINSCRRIITFLEKNKIERTEAFYYYLTPALIIQKQFNEAQTVIQKALSQVNKGSYSWSVYTYYRFVLELHRRDYKAAHALFQTAERKRHINKAMREQWLIVRGFVKFLMRVGRIEGSGHFKLGKFLNEVPVFTADKAGNNVNIIILQLLHNLGRNNDFLIDKKEAITKYAERYLKSGSRARMLLRLLLKIPHYNFDKRLILQKTEKLTAQLKNSSLQVDNADIEIIPYDDLWELTLELL